MSIALIRASDVSPALLRLRGAPGRRPPPARPRSPLETLLCTGRARRSHQGELGKCWVGVGLVALRIFGFRKVIW